MPLTFEQINPVVRFASEVVKSVDYTEFLCAYDHRLFYLLSGNITFDFLDESIPLSAGNLLLIPPAVPYKLIFANGEPARYILLNFDFDDLLPDTKAMPPSPVEDFDENKIISRADLEPFDKVYAEDTFLDLEDDLRRLIGEVDRPDVYSGIVIAALMKQILVKILRSGVQNTSSSSQSLCDTIEAYVLLHYREGITNLSISEKLGYHPYYLNSVFVKCRKQTLHGFIMQVRLEKAKKALLCTQDPISDIAEDCGFSNASYFSKCFRQAYGKRPNEYRNQGR